MPLIKLSEDRVMKEDLSAFEANLVYLYCEFQVSQGYSTYSQKKIQNGIKIKISFI